MPEKNDELLKQQSPWSNNSNTVWLASNISLRRNIEKFKFPSKMDVERRKQIISLLSKEMLTSHLLKGAILLKGEETSPLEKEFLVEHTLTPETFQSAHLGEAFLVERTGQFLASINLKDHLHLQEVDIKGEIEATWGRLAKLESQIGQTITYAYSPQFGFLTADPMECGTGLKAMLFLQLSALIHSGKLTGELEKIKEEQVQTQNFLGHTDSCIGDILVLSNTFSLGVNEESLLATLRNFAHKLIQLETSLRKQMGQEESASIKDKVSRAYAILVHSYQIETQEALNAIALLKLGCDLNWIDGISMASLNNLFFNCRRAHLLRHFPEKVEQEQIPHKRAEFIHKGLQGVKLLI